MGPYIRRLTDEYSSYIHQLNFIFLLLSILAASPDGEPLK
jgi:hypothetical protein